MIIVRSPLRISLGGGGTDLPSYYRHHEGFLIAAAINRYVYISVSNVFQGKFIITYSSKEIVDTYDSIKHPIVRECINMTELQNCPIEVTSMADIPAGTGLGSSGSFTTALLKGLYAYQRQTITQKKLAEAACEIELERLREPIGKQDQFIAAYGGITCFTFGKDDSVAAENLRISPATLAELEDNLLLYFTGFTRQASSILAEQDVKSKEKDADMVANLHFIKDLGYQSKSLLEKGDLNGFAELMNIHWQSKKRRSQSMSNTAIDDVYDFARKNGALGGKLIGAGGGGFLLFYVEDRARFRRAMSETQLQEVRFSFEFEGTKILIDS
jgi:D-glycero-alpha-D-manno-heptose-7-phosphate kinase